MAAPQVRELCPNLRPDGSCANAIAAVREIGQDPPRHFTIADDAKLQVGTGEEAVSGGKICSACNNIVAPETATVVKTIYINSPRT